jgi:hypothetical protein
LRIAITSNGPGEFAGWVRPLVAALQRLEPATEITLYFVPDDYATGREAGVARRLFPSVHVVAPADYLRFALGGGLRDVPESADVVQYLGGDLLHAARVQARLGGSLRTYKFARRRGRTADRAYAVDAKNAADLGRAGVPAGRIEIVGNLAVDGALGEATGAYPRSGGDAALEPGGILIMPGTRKAELENMVPLFLQAALRLREHTPSLQVGFAISPFTTENELARVLNAGGHRNVWGARGRVVALGAGAGIGIVADEGGVPFPVVRDAMRHAPQARLVVTIPGTKCIELAALGVPALVCVPLNAPEVVVINGPLQYVDRIPAIGILLKRATVIAVDKHFAFTAQPNIDSGEVLMPELRGTLMPGEVARRIGAYARDDAALSRSASRLRALYANHAGAAERMAKSLLAGLAS